MKATIFIEIEGGNIRKIVSNTGGVNIKIIDKDLIEEEQDESNYIPDSIMTDEGIKEYIKKEYSAEFQKRFKYC